MAATSRIALQLKSPIEIFRSCLHIHQANAAFAAVDFKPFSIIGDLQADAVFRFFEVNRDLRGFGMFQYIVQLFLQNPIHSKMQFFF